MRNLKRALSLALASVMVMGLAVVGSNASYVDVTSKQNQEAIEVLQKVGIMVGDENGKFNPEAKVTRNEMAVIMANLMDYRVASYKGTSPFTDVPDWAEPYVAACYTNGIISGYSAKTFGGSDPVSTSQAALMLMKALGYFQYQSDFADDWQLATVKQGNKIELFEDVDSGVKESMTRNDVAQLVLNALESGMVEADNDTIKVTTGDTKVEAGKVNYNYVTSAKSYARAISSLYPTSATSATEGYIVELGEKLYNGDLKVVKDTDKFGAPANRWTYKNAEVGTYANSPDYTFSGVVKSSDFYDAVGKTVADKYDWTVYVDGQPGVGDATASTVKDAVYKDNKADVKATVRGSDTYVYLDDSTKNGDATVVIKNIYVGEVTKVKDGTVTIDDMKKGALDIDATGYSEGDMVLYNKTIDKVDKHEIQTILGKAELKEGTVETVRDDDRIVIDGTTYKYAAQFNSTIDSDKLKTESVDQKVSFYLDGQGNIIAFEDAAANNDYAFVFSVGEANSQYNQKDSDYGAKLIMADGTVKSVILDSDTADRYVKGVIGYDKDNKVTAAATRDAKLKKLTDELVGKVVAYTVESDGDYSLTERSNKDIIYTGAAGDVKDVVKNGSARVNDKDGKSVFYTDKNTVFLVNEDGTDDDFDAYVGYKNVPNINADKNSKITAYLNKDGVAKFVVLTDVESKGSSNDVVFVVGKNQKTIKANKTGSTEYYVYDAVVNGEVTSLKVKRTSNAQTELSKLSADKIGVFFGITKNSDGYVKDLDTKLPTDVAYQTYTGVKRESNGGNVSFGAITDKNNVVTGYTTSMAANEKALIVYYDGDALSVETRLVTDQYDEATVVTDDGDIIAICVLDKDANGLVNG